MTTKILTEKKPDAKKPGPKAPHPGQYKKGTVANPKGRPPGIPNKRTIAAKALADSLGIDPLEILLKIADGRYAELNPDLPPEALKHKDGTPKTIAIDTRRQAATDASKFLYPTLKALEVTGKDDTPLAGLLSLTPQELERRQAEIAVALGDD